MTDFSSIQQHLTAITTAQTDFAKSSFEASKAYFEKLAAVKSPDKFTELTAEYAKSAQEMFFAEATKIGELYRTFARKPSSRSLQAFYPSDRIERLLPASADPPLTWLSPKAQCRLAEYLWEAALCVKTGPSKSPALSCQ